MILLVSLCKVGFQPFKFTCAGRLQLQRCRRLMLKWFLLCFLPCLVWIFITLCVLVLCVWDTCMFDLLPNTTTQLRVLGQAKSRFHFTQMRVLFTIYIRNALSEVFWNGATLPTLRSEVKQTSSSLKTDFSHHFWKSQHLPGCLSRARMVSVFLKLLMWSLFKISFYPFPLTIPTYTWPFFRWIILHV